MAKSVQDSDLFSLNSLIVNINIKLSARIECGVKQLLSLVTSNGELVLHYVFGGMKPIARRIPWFDDNKKEIRDLCFDPSATWLLVLALDASLYIIPALKILDPEQKIDCKWAVNDLTYFPKSTKSPNGMPNCVIWWQTLDCNQNAIVGYETGEICFVSLTDGQTIGVASISGPVIGLQICSDNCLDLITLLINSEKKQQWKLVLEKRSNGYTWSPDGSRLTAGDLAHLSYASVTGMDTEPKTSRSRLQGLKQMSVEKIASLKQKLAETRAKRDIFIEPLERKSSLSSEINTAPLVDITVPDKIVNLGETLLRPQYSKNRHLFSGFFSSTCILTIQGAEVESSPLYVHKLHTDCIDILVTDRFFYTIDENNAISVVSCQLSESRLDGDSEFNPDALITTFRLPKVDEKILAIYKLTDVSVPNDTLRREDDHTKSNKMFKLPKSVADLNVRNPKVDTCTIVTNQGVYRIVVNCSIIDVFMHLVCEENNIEKAERLAYIFGLNLQYLLEQAGDLMLNNNKFAPAISLYKSSRCRLLKSVLKFAVAGNAGELLSYIQTCLTAPNIEMSLPTKIHLSNLAVMSYTEIHLRRDDQETHKAMNMRLFIDFLSRNDYFDQVLAVNVLCQTALWSLMSILVRTRGLVYDVLETICKLFKSSTNTTSVSSTIDLDDVTLHQCITEPINLQCLVVKPSISKVFLSFIRLKLDVFESRILKRLVKLLDPSQAVARPMVAKLFDAYKTKHKMKSSSSELTIDPVENTDASDEQLTAFQDLIETFIVVVLKLINKFYNGPSFDGNLMELAKTSYPENNEVLTLHRKYRTLSAGFGHVCLIRNNVIWSWGNTANGCLGLGPLMTKCQLPQPIQVMNQLCSEIISVSCGRTHTLFLTNYGVYACGSNIYGQLGLGPIIKTSYPMLIESISSEQIVEICAGQYHSLALTAKGKLYSWGWGVHGQLGHGNVEDVRVALEVSFFKNMVVAQVAAGHAHTVVLNSKGVAYSFGSNLFGQLGNGTTVKSNIPQQIRLPEKVVLVSTEYFQNFAVSVTNKLYTWGASPQVLRLAAQAQKKAKMVHQANLMVGDVSITRPQPEVISTPTSEDPAQISSDRSADEGTITKKSFKGGDTSKELPATEFPNKITPKSPSDILDENTDVKVESRPQSPRLGRLNRSKTPTLAPEVEGQPHLTPKVVNTSNVNGIIVIVVSGCHHAALLTKDGTLYTWGKNLDGQLGTGNRKEVLIPTPIKVNTANFVSGVNLPVQQEDSALQELKCKYVSCGAEYTVAVDTVGRVLAWGCNANAQLGKLPDEDQKGLEGKMVLLRATKRVIKLPSSVQNICDTPKEILSIPAQTINYRNVDRKSFINLYQPQFYPLNMIECQGASTNNDDNNQGKLFKYGPKTLHFVLETYLGFYDSEKIMKKCLQYENYQAASKISFMDCYFTDSLNYQLKALEVIMHRNGCKLSSSDLNASHTTNEDILKVEIDYDSCKMKLKLLDKCLEKIKQDETNTGNELSFSPSLESIKQFGDDVENQGGCEEMCDDIPGDVQIPKVAAEKQKLDDSEEQKHLLVRNTVLEYVENIDAKLISDDTLLLQTVECQPLRASNLSSQLNDIEKIKETDSESAVQNDQNDIQNSTKEKDKSMLHVNGIDVVSSASQILMFYIEKTQNTENHILMQNILIKSMNFWLSNNLPVDILENILLKNMAKYFYPLSVLLFCKNFNNNVGEAITANDGTEQSHKSFVFLKQLSTKFCLQLCSMVLKNVNKPSTTNQEV